MNVESLDRLVGPSDKTKAFVVTYNRYATLVDTYLEEPDLHKASDNSQFDDFMYYAVDQITNGIVKFDPNISNEDYIQLLKNILFEFLTPSSEEPWEVN